MAQELDDLHFWLPAEFLTEDDLLTDFKTNCKCNRLGSKAREVVDGLSTGFGNSGLFGMDLSSPVSSPAPTAETESDEDDFIIAELTRRVARSGLYSGNMIESRKLPGSPQSTLCGCKPVPQGESGFVSRVAAPQNGYGNVNELRRWDCLCAAAEEAARLRLIEEAAAFYSTKLLAPKSRQNPNPNPPNFYWNQAQTSALHTYHRLHAARFELMKKQQMMKNGGVPVSTQGGTTEYQNGKGNEEGRRATPQGLSMSGWPTLQPTQLQLQQQTGSGMTGIFLGEPGKKKERTGTGVFMPRRFVSNSSSDHPPRKKSAGTGTGRSTVLLPDKVVHALNLNLNLDPINNVPHTHTPPRQHFSPHLDAAAAATTGGGGGLKPTNTVGLPQEWTY